MESVALNTPRPYVNGSYLQKSINKQVTLFGSVLKLNASGQMVTLQTTDDQVVTVNFEEPVDCSPDGWLEVMGFVKDKNIINATNCINVPSSLSNDFDKSHYNEMVNLIHNLSNPLK